MDTPSDPNESAELDGELRTLTYHLSLWTAGSVLVSNAGTTIEAGERWIDSDPVVVALGVVGLAALVHSVHAVATATYLHETTPNTAVTYGAILLLAALGLVAGVAYAPG